LFVCGLTNLRGSTTGKRNGGSTQLHNLIMAQKEIGLVPSPAQSLFLKTDYRVSVIFSIRISSTGEKDFASVDLVSEQSATMASHIASANSTKIPD
jgi:hypothetical protein